MLQTSLLPRRIVHEVIKRNRAVCACFYSNGSEPKATGSFKGKRQNARGVKHGEDVTANRADESKGPSLFDQLFPDVDEEAQRKQEREVPRIPLEPAEKFAWSKVIPFGSSEVVEKHNSARRLRDTMSSTKVETTVLVMRNASKNLTEEDFRRLIPQGRHMEGWTLEQDDIIKVIPGRDLATLAQQNYYYLLFKSPLGAFTYQGHATRIHQIVATQTPTSILSPMPPPPGYMLQGMDAHAAMESFSLVPPNQSLTLRQLKPPLAPLVESIVRWNGYASLMKRQDRMPYEARLILEGPQLHQSSIRHVLYVSGKERGLSWSGGEESAPRLTRWEPISKVNTPSPTSVKGDAHKWVRTMDSREEVRTKSGAVKLDYLHAADDGGDERDDDDRRAKAEQEHQKRRTALLVYVVGFHTEGAMQSFVRFWHRRPMEWKGIDRGRGGDVEDDLAPIANVEVLW